MVIDVQRAEADGHAAGGVHDEARMGIYAEILMPVGTVAEVAVVFRKPSAVGVVPELARVLEAEHMRKIPAAGGARLDYPLCHVFHL